MISLTIIDLAIAALLVVRFDLLSMRLQTGISRLQPRELEGAQ